MYLNEPIWLVATLSTGILPARKDKASDAEKVSARPEEKIHVLSAPKNVLSHRSVSRHVQLHYVLVQQIPGRLVRIYVPINALFGPMKRLGGVGDGGNSSGGD